MNPADRIIVALDLPTRKAWQVVCDIIDNTDVRFFKLSASNLLGPSGDLISSIRSTFSDSQVMLDLKVYDTPTSVRRIVSDSFKAGATFVTVHPDCLEPALEAKREPEQRVIPVMGLTSDGLNRPFDWGYKIVEAAGIVVCSPALVEPIKHVYPHMITVCPGIRQAAGDDGGHAETWGPAAAVRAGADYLVIGRPITTASDPVAAVRAIVAELEKIDGK